MSKQLLEFVNDFLGSESNALRFCDSFIGYEQKLIREQVAQLTGRRFLTGYSNDEEEYRALMTNGATFAQQYQLIPGIALTDTQVAQLTSDIVWLVEQTVTLPDGTQTQALVPQLYARLQPGDLSPTGSLIAGQTLNLNVKNQWGQTPLIPSFLHKANRGQTTIYYRI